MIVPCLIERSIEIESGPNGREYKSFGPIDTEFNKDSRPN
jgi:hypothetical protein